MGVKSDLIIGVMLDQINLERCAGLSAKEALIKASVSRLCPVSMAAGTTVLGVMPLLSDVFSPPWLQRSCSACWRQRH
ncbi:MAG: efflux RND transporter permease subunit [Alphaproteobacteria bacterium]|nr:efflux RND transporter permease subunit [Alphaproteobacteria bacterium]